MNEIEAMDKVNSFFKPQNLNSSKNNLNFHGPNGNLEYERMYFNYYESMLGTFKSKIPLQLPESKIIGQSGWEPLLKAGHHGFVITLKNFIPFFSSASEIGILTGCFEVLRLHGMGFFELGLAPKNSFMKITVGNSLEDLSYGSMEEKPANPVCAFTAGMVLACYNLSMSSVDVSAIEPGNLDLPDKMYRESPDIVQVEYGSITGEESHFVLQAKT